jgi:thiamine kinase-like enzyme
MRYYYIHPFKPQYFFPKDFKAHKIMGTFYTPYSKIGTTSWQLFNKSFLFRALFSKRNIEKYIPEKKIRAIVGDTATMAFNTGTPGIEQKITALGVLNTTEFFIKYAQTPLAKSNVINEHHVLKQLAILDYVPKVLDFYKDETQVLLKTTVLKGERVTTTSMNDALLSSLFDFEEMHVSTTNKVDATLKTCFAHGDFCPWNMMIKEQKLLFFDWEMAATYPIGYDLFTFIFQTPFLLEPEKSIAAIIGENKAMIVTYFSRYRIKDWESYLRAFAKQKLLLETNKGEGGLLKKYNALLNET